MLTIARLFGQSPFAPLQTHINKVASCIEKLTGLIAALGTADMAAIEKLSAELSELEHEADLTKNDIRNHLPKSIFLPIDRSQFLEILAVQDSIADRAEEVGILLTLHPLEHYKKFATGFNELYALTLETFNSSLKIMREIEELLESSFGGIEAEKVKAMVEETAFKEHKATRSKHDLQKRLYASGTEFSPPAFYLWMKVLEAVSNISGSSERLANRIRMILELK
jgi:predicted phosphate transport protein (TIGR00153 family)